MYPLGKSPQRGYLRGLEGSQVVPTYRKLEESYKLCHSQHPHMQVHT